MKHDTLLKLALDEDLGVPWRDATTDFLFLNDDKKCNAKIISKHSEDIIICGLELIRDLINRFDSTCQIQSEYQDGQWLSSHETLLELIGNPKTILKIERIALNFLRHLCAISTLTRKYVERVKSTSLKILDTRKTTPGLRRLEKYAVHCGGGVNHRMGLYDAIMLKDTHIDILGGMQKALLLLPEKSQQSIPIIVEVRSIDELSEIMKYGLNKVNRVLLDNMSLEEMRKCLDMCQGVFETEASGNISLENVLEIAHMGVQYASIGRLTYGAGHVDLSMQITSRSC